MSRLLTFAFVLVAVFASASLSGDHIGASSSCINDKCIVGGGASIGSLIVSAAIITFLFLRPNQPIVIDADAVVGVRRRLGAFFLDFVLVLLAVAPIVALPLLIVEASYTGEFEWYFVRKFARPSDALLILPSVLASFAVLYFYFFYHPWKDKQTVGEYISGIKIVAESEIGFRPIYGTRPILGFIGLCAWPVSVYFALRKLDKKFWWDSETRTRAVMVEASPGN